MLRLKHEGLLFLHDEFALRHQQKQVLGNIRNYIVDVAPCLRDRSEFKHWGSGIYYLWFRCKNRSAMISFYGNSEVPEVVCHWDECSLFTFPAPDLPVLGSIFKRWLCHEAMPSEMRREFPFLSIGTLANYYEAGKPVEGEFIDSWDRLEQFYDMQQVVANGPVLQFIGELRRAGHDRTFRAGQSLVTLALSRSRRHGLRPDQPHIRFDFSSDCSVMATTLKFGGHENTFTSGVGMSDDLTAALAKLSKYPID